MVTHGKGQHRFFIGTYLNIKFRGVSVLFAVFVRGLLDFPIAPEMFDHRDGHRFILAVAQGYRNVLFGNPLGHPPMILDRALADYVEGVAQINAYLFVFRSVIDLILADELERTIFIGLHDTDFALG